LLPIDERSATERLILQKSLSAEKAEITIDRDRNAEMVAELEAFDRLQSPFEKPTRDTIGKLDEILRHWAEGGAARRLGSQAFLQRGEP
jgi:hypothetical protein